jgi:integrase
MHGKQTSTGTAALSPKSVKEMMTLVKAALRQARQWDYIANDPSIDVKVPTIRRRNKPTLQEEQLQHFLQSLQGARDYPLVAFAVASGCRRGEILAVRIENLNFETGQVEINSSLEQTTAGLRLKATKSETPRLFTLPQWILPILREHVVVLSHEKQTVGSGYRDHGLLFPDRDGSYQTPDNVGRRINCRLKKAGLPNTLHGLRHFHASWLLSEGTPLPAVSARLGHANPAITLAIYAHVMRTDDSAVADALHQGLAGIVPRPRELRPRLVTPSDTGTVKKASGI